MKGHDAVVLDISVLPPSSQRKLATTLSKRPALRIQQVDVEQNTTTGGLKTSVEKSVSNIVPSEMSTDELVDEILQALEDASEPDATTDVVSAFEDVERRQRSGSGYESPTDFVDVYVILINSILVLIEGLKLLQDDDRPLVEKIEHTTVVSNVEYVDRSDADSETDGETRTDACCANSSDSNDTDLAELVGESQRAVIRITDDE